MKKKKKKLDIMWTNRNYYTYLLKFLSLYDEENDELLVYKGIKVSIIHYHIFKHIQYIDYFL